MTIRRALVLYKKSVYEVHSGKAGFGERRFRISHELHRETLKEVRRALGKAKLPYRAAYRSVKVDPGPYGLIISVGGDGTFLEAARRAKDQLVLGVNSDPVHSVGSFCAASRLNFERILLEVLEGRLRPCRLSRLALCVNGRMLPHPVLNEVLFCHRNPAAMSRYWIQVGRVREEHRNSGLWISTAAGSTGAIRSAGGRALPWGSKKIQYWPRELYRKRKSRYRLTGGVVGKGQKLAVGSMIREGRLYLDGPHLGVPFGYGDKLEVSASPFPLNILMP